MATKKERAQLFAKYNGRCAYCGCELPEKFHVDEILPCKRIKQWDRTKRKFVHVGYEYPERLHIDNQNPACPSCNINKHAMSLEEFRRLVGGFLTSLNRDSTQYKIAKRFGFIEEKPKPVVFYFETLNQ